MLPPMGDTPVEDREFAGRTIQALTDGRAAYVARMGDAQAAMSSRGGDPISALTALLTADGTLTSWCAYRYELRLHRARGYGALKAILEILAEDEPLTLTEIAHRLQRTPGSTKDYLSWLEDVDLILSRQKRYSFADPLMRLWVRLHCRPVPPVGGRSGARGAGLRGGAPAGSGGHQRRSASRAIAARSASSKSTRGLRGSARPRSLFHLGGRQGSNLQAFHRQARGFLLGVLLRLPLPLGQHLVVDNDLHREQLAVLGPASPTSRDSAAASG